jgi:hypothetical protein
MRPVVNIAEYSFALRRGDDQPQRWEFKYDDPNNPGNLIALPLAANFADAWLQVRTMGTLKEIIALELGDGLEFDGDELVIEFDRLNTLVRADQYQYDLRFELMDGQIRTYVKGTIQGMRIEQNITEIAE